MRSLAIKLGVLAVALLMFAALPRTAAADSYTLEGVSLDSFSLGSGDSFTASMPLGLLSGLLALDEPLGLVIPDLTVDDTTTGTVYDFKNDLVVGYDLEFFPLAFASQIDYTSVSVATPEPSEIALLALGLFALALASKKLRALRASPVAA
jgi:hypothetical protein